MIWEQTLYKGAWDNGVFGFLLSRLSLCSAVHGVTGTMIPMGFFGSITLDSVRSNATHNRIHEICWPCMKWTREERGVTTKAKNKQGGGAGRERRRGLVSSEHGCSLETRDPKELSERGMVRLK